MMVLSLTWVLMLFVLALAVSFVCSGSETGFISANPIRVRTLAEERQFGARALRRLLERREQTLATVLIGNNLALVLATMTGLSLLERVLVRAGWPATEADRTAGLLTPLLLTPIILFGCEILPKSIFRARPIRMTRFVAPFLVGVEVIAAPVSAAFGRLTRALVRAVSGREAEPHSLVTREEMRRLFAQGVKSGSIEADEREMIQGIIDLGQTIASEVMIPRMQLRMARKTATCGELYDLISQEGHSRVPIYEERVDNVIGVVHVRDLLGGAYEQSAPITPVIRPVLHVPDSMPLDEVFRKLRGEQRTVAMVVDEHGGTAGMVTLEDVLEEIVGEIRDEYDEDETPSYRRLQDESWLVAGNLPIHEAQEALHLDIPDTGVVETIGGFLIHRLGRIPKTGETIHVGRMHFQVVAATHRAIERVRIRIHEPADEE